MTFRSTIPTFSSPPPSIFSSSSSSGSIFGGGSFDPYAGIHFSKPKSASPSTLLQAYKLGLEQARAKKSGGHGLMDSIEHGGGSLLHKALDVVSRPGWAMAEAFKEGAHGHDPFTRSGKDINWSGFLKGFKTGLSGKKHTTFGQLLEENHHLDHHTFLRGAAGLGLDVALDPTSYLFGAGAFGDSAKFGLKLGLHDAEKLGSKAGMGAAARSAQRYQGELDSLNLGTKGSKDAYNAAGGLLAKRNLAERVALHEERLNQKKYLELRFGVTKANSVGLRTPLRLRNTTAKRLEKLATSGSLATRLQKAMAEVRPGYANPTGHEMEMGTRHLIEQVNADLFKEVSRPLRAHARELKETGMMHALFAAETKGVVKNRKLDETVLDAALRAEHFTGKRLEQAKAFVRDWHTATEHLARQDAHFGIEVAHVGEGENGIVYVPHVFDRKGREILTRSLLSKGSHELARKSGLSYRQAVEMADQGKFRGFDVATNPIEMLARRVRSGAVAQGHQALRDFVRDTYGVASREFDSGRFQEVSKGLRSRQRRLARLGTEKSQLVMRQKAAVDRLSQRHAAEVAAHPATMRKRLADVRKELRRTDLKGHEKGRLVIERNRLQAKIASTPKATESVARMQARHAEEANTVVLSHETRLREADANIHALAQDIKRLTPRVIAKAYKKNPEFVHETLVDIAQLGRKDARGVTIRYRVPAEVHESIAKVEKVLKDEESGAVLANAVNKAMSKWKVAVTVVNPGYHVRNMVSDFWNMYLSGVPLWALPRFAKRAGELMVKASKGDPQSMAIMRQAAHHGILSGFFVGDVKKAAELHGGKFTASRVAKGVTTASGHRENWGRLIHYLYRTEHEKMAPAFAAQEVRRAHFDYEELTPFERNKLKAYIPFYTWTRKNVPYQLQQIISRPGRVATYVKVAEESERESGVKPGEIIGHALDSHPLAFKTPFGYLDPQTGLGDLARIQDPKQLLGMLNPVAKIAVELGSNKSLYTGQPIYGDATGHSRVPAPGIVAGIAGALGIDSGRTERSIDGKQVAGPGVNPLLGYAAGQLPLTSFLMTRNTIDQSRKGNNRAYSYLAGLSFTEVDTQEEQLIAQIEARDREDRAVRNARDLNLLAESKPTKTSPFQKRMNGLINRSLTRR